MNRPTDRIHCINWGFGRLLVPWFGGWLAWSEGRRKLRFAPSGKFHNCRATGVY